VADLTEGPVPRPLTLELVVHLADRGTRGGWLPYMQLLFALEVATGRSREVCVSAIMGAVLSGYLDVEKVDQMLAIGRVRITAAGRSLVPKPEPAVTGFPRPDDRLAGLDPILSAMADGFVRAVSLAVAAELRLWSAACRRMVERAREGQEFPGDDDDLSPFDGGRVAVYEGMAAHLDRRAGGLAEFSVTDEQTEPTEPTAPEWSPGDPVHPAEVNRGYCSNAVCGTTWVPSDVQTCPECGTPMKVRG
jgi:hypothetical protein